MTKDEVKKIVQERILGNKVGVNVFMTPAQLTNESVIKNWTDKISSTSNSPTDTQWFVYIDHMPNANFEHPVEYLFINDKTGAVEKINGTSPPDNLDKMEKIQ